MFLTCILKHVSVDFRGAVLFLYVYTIVYGR